MKFLSESQILDESYITEGKDGEKDAYIIEGIFMQAEIKNRNGRIYPKEVLFESTNRLKKDIPSGLLGELEHPTSNGGVINWQRAAMKITDLWEDGTNIMGKARVSTNLALGGLVMGVLREGVKIGVSSRGFGTVKESKGVNIVQSPFYLKTVDIVTTPSAPDAIMNAVMESKEWIYENGMLIEREAKALVNESVRKRIPSEVVFDKIINMIVENTAKNASFNVFNKYNL